MTHNSKLIGIIIKFIKDEILKSDIRTEIIKPILIYTLYYIIPFLIIFILLNFITTITAVFLVFKIKK
jgi:flagellar biosynthesis protein FlhB